MNTATFPVYHFQDDAVTGSIGVNFIAGTSNQLSLNETGFQPLNYINGVDGPTGISAFSQDQAFELYTTSVPEPVAGIFLGAMTAVIGRRRRCRFNQR